MRWTRWAILAAAAISLASCDTTYSKLYPLPLTYRHGAPHGDFGHGPLPIAGQSPLRDQSK